MKPDPDPLSPWAAITLAMGISGAALLAAGVTWHAWVPCFGAAVAALIVWVRS